MAVPFLLPPRLAAIPDYPTIGESVLFQLNGLVVVCLALGSIWGMLELIGVFFRRPKSAVASPQPSSAPAPSAVAAPATNDIPPELVAAISAAVHLAIAGRPHRIAAIVSAPVKSELDWAREGRRTIFASHKTR